MSNVSDSFDINNQPRAADTVPAIPTSASEVSVRTMTSDLELMGQSGGMVNQAAPQAMAVPVVLHPEAAAGQTPQPSSSGRGKMILIMLGVIVAIAGLLALGYFVVGK